MIKKLIIEAIKYSEVLDFKSSVQSVIDGKRGLAFVAIGENPEKEPEILHKAVKDHKLKLMKVERVDGEAYILYRPGSEKFAEELKAIAEKYGGYLHKDANEKDTRRIGELLNYYKADIDNHLKNKNK